MIKTYTTALLWLILCALHPILSQEANPLPDPKTLIKELTSANDSHIKGYVIPKVLFKMGPQEAYENHEGLKALLRKNGKISGYKIAFFNDEAESRRIFEKYFPKSYLLAYDLLKPKTFKSDLFRLAILYLCGGVYGDLPQDFLLNPANYIHHKRHEFVCIKDIKHSNLNGMLTSFMAAYPRHPLVKFILDGLVQEILCRRIPRTTLDATGPAACLRYYNDFFQQQNNQPLHFGRTQSLMGLDNKLYLIKVPFKLIVQDDSRVFLIDKMGRKVILAKTLFYHQIFVNRKHYSTYDLEDIYESLPTS